MDGGRLNFSIGDNGQMFCPFLEKQNNSPPIGNIKYDTGCNLSAIKSVSSDILQHKLPNLLTMERCKYKVDESGYK